MCDAPEPSLKEKYGDLAAVYTDGDPYQCSEAVYSRMFIECHMLDKLSATYGDNLLAALAPRVVEGGTVESSRRMALLMLLASVAKETLAHGFLPTANPTDSAEVFRDIVNQAHETLDCFVEGLEPPSLFPQAPPVSA